MSEFKQTVETCVRECTDIKQASHGIYEANVMMQNILAISEALYVQDELDKKYTRLYGINEEFMTVAEQKSKSNLKINQNCVSCSGNAQYIKKAFKLACLNYNESKVVYQKVEYERNQLHEIKNDIIKKAREILE